MNDGTGGCDALAGCGFHLDDLRGVRQWWMR
jgi:hypothetical protein